MTGGDDVVEHLFGEVPELGAAIGDVPVARDDAIVGDAMAGPGGAVGAAVQKHGLEAIDGGGEFGFGGLSGFELIPECAELARLIFGQQAEDAVGGTRFAFVLIGHRGGVVGEGVAGVDFDEVVDDDHLQDAKDVEGRDVGVFGQDDHTKAEMPGVFGVVFVATAASVERLPEDLLQPVAFDDEFDLAFESQGGGLGRDRGAGCHRVNLFLATRLARDFLRELFPS